jgi:hypothetical protein
VRGPLMIIAITPCKQIAVAAKYIINLNVNSLLYISHEPETVQMTTGWSCYATIKINVARIRSNSTVINALKRNQFDMLYNILGRSIRVILMIHKTTA